ncbi:MAG: 50S ribosomal protein L24 [Planctomycetes bacterium]|nr:50S ribosomal protein L24 [Planctomycetota bacterium]
MAVRAAWKQNLNVNRKVHVKKGDKVVVLSGAYASNEPHEVLQVNPDTGRIVVQGVNLRWKHTKRTQQNPQGGRVQREFPIHASKVLLWSEKAGKGVRTRAQIIDGKKVRVGVPCGTRFD